MLFTLRLSLIYCGYITPSASSVESSPRSLLVFSSNDNTFDRSTSRRRRYCDFMFDSKTLILTEPVVCWECCLTLSPCVVSRCCLSCEYQTRTDPYDWTRALHTTSLYIVMGNLWSSRWFYSGKLWLGSGHLSNNLIMISGYLFNLLWHDKDGD